MGDAGREDGLVLWGGAMEADWAVGKGRLGVGANEARREGRTERGREESAAVGARLEWPFEGAGAVHWDWAAMGRVLGAAEARGEV